MKAKEKAEELVDKYFIVIDNSHPLDDILKTAKQCALIAVDELIEEIRSKYWYEVKREIKQL